MGLVKRLGVLLVRPLRRLLVALRSSALLSGRRVPRWVLWLGASSVFLWPSRTSAQSGTTTPTAVPTEHTPAGPYVVGGLILAGLLVAGYTTLRVIQRREWPDVGHIVAIVAPTTAVTAGVRLGVVAISANNLGPFSSDDRVFIPLAGLALVLVSAKAIYEVVRDGARAVSRESQLAETVEPATSANVNR